MLKYALLALCTLTTGTLAHMKPESPCMRGSSVASCGYDTPDYSLSAPIGTAGKVTFPICHHTKPYAKAVATFNAGSNIPVTFAEGGAIHGGGNCQFSLSYDGGKTFVVIMTIMRTCFKNGLKFSVPIPPNAPSGDMVVFSWSWANAVGNREFYQTCSDIAIKGKTGGSITGPMMVTPNYNDPKNIIPEFGAASQDDGSAIYDAAKIITVTAKGSSTGSKLPSSTPTSSPDVQDENDGATKISSYSSTPAPTATPDTDKDSEKKKKKKKSKGDKTKSTTVTSTGTTATDPATEAPAPSTSDDADSDSDTSSTPTSKPDKAIHCERSGKSPRMITISNGRRYTTTCAADLVCIQKGSTGPYCDRPNSK
ncbi:hypothetical protein IWQ60_010500 [Tieghemiomyces parasiticus]|uniref:Uncharacterized protein n=1 Tax=Tieghemiomyces parasiticus TaxID=78921 RepID=A0A9W7ZUC6_9FUNG|nr:hypothetical protein IWQ60_010500 [Tieghemiomyces parasiticus]